MPLPPAARALATDRLAALDAAAPGLVTAVWVTGSAASGDWHPGVSDVDTVGALAREPTAGDLAALAADPSVDGIFLPAAALADPPVAGEPVPHVVGGAFSTGPCGECTPVTWLELRRGGVPLRGPAPATVVPAPDPGALRDWLLGNLRGYWTAEADAVTAALAGRPADRALSAEAAMWQGLGPARLLITLETGEVVSKTAAGRWVADRFPAFAELARRCVAARSGAPVAFTTADGRAAVALNRAVVAAAVRG
jgi:hypothetical protein